MPGADIFEDFLGAKDDVFEDLSGMVKDILYELNIDLSNLPRGERKAIADKIHAAMAAAYPRAATQARSEIESELRAEAASAGGQRGRTNHSQ